jgi:hypothetical protein
MRCLVLVTLCFIGCAPDVDRFKDPVDAAIMDISVMADARPDDGSDGGMDSSSDMTVPNTCSVRFQVGLPDATLTLQRNSDGAAIDRVLEDGQTVQYKYTLGTWETAEVQSDCQEKPNREWTVDCGEAMPEVLDEVDAWNGRCP